MGAATARVIDPRGLTLAQRAENRCAYANCLRSLTRPKTLIGSTPDGTPIFVCNATTRRATIDREPMSAPSWAQPRT
jgi:hypothetical protein